MPDTALPKNENTCEYCSGQLKSIRFGGLCPRCLFSQVVTGISADDHPALQPIAITGKSPTIEQLNAEILGFKFQRMIGRGASGWTFLATQISLAREVAVKILPRKTRTDQSVERFRMEAENLAKLNHPRIVTAHDFGSTTNYNFIVMEYVAGQTLRVRMQHQTFSAEEAVEIVRQICEATEYAHLKGLLHRDIKPENVLFVSKSIEDGIKVADFGIAKITDQSTTRQDLTYTGVTLGTPFYMAPEQSMTGETDFRADVYSIGVLFYELLTGRLPLGRFRAPSSFCDGSRELDKVVFRSLANSVEDRFQSAKEFHDSLDGVNSPGLNWKPVAVGLLSLGLLVAVIASSFFRWSAEPVEPSRHVVFNDQQQPRATAPKSYTAIRTEKESEGVALVETAENPFETYEIPDAAPVNTKVGNNQSELPRSKPVKREPITPAPLTSEPVTPDVTVNQLMLEQVAWSVMPVAEKPRTKSRASNRVVAFPTSFFSKPYHNRLSDIVFDRDRKSAIATLGNSFEDFTELISVDVLNRTVRSRHQLPGKKRSPIAVSSDGTRVVTLEKGWGSKPGKISFWNTRDDDLKLDVSWNTAAPFDRDGFSPTSGMLLDDQHLLTFGKRIVLWDVEAARAVYSYQSETKPTFDANSNRLAFRNGSSIGIIEATKGNVIGTIECEPELASLAFSSSGKKLAGCSTAGSVWIWDLTDGKIDNTANTPDGRAGSIEWVGDEFVLVGNQYLIDVRLGVAVWQYKKMTSPIRKISHDRFWITSKTALSPVRLPHKKMEDMTKIESEQLSIFKPGISVALTTDLIFDDQVSKDIRKTLENKLTALGVSIDASSDMSLFASVVAGEKQSTNMTTMHDTFGRRGQTMITFTPHVSALSLRRGEETIWKQQISHSASSVIHPQRSETLQQAADRMCEPKPDFFSSVKLPHNLKALPKQFTVGESSLDQSR